MKLVPIRVALAMGMMAIVALACSPSQEDAPIMDKDIRYTRYEEVGYPPLARQTRTQGLVVIKIRLDEHGKVTQATAMSGQELLIESAIANAKKWQFEPNSRNAAVLVYNFRMATGLCHSSFSIFEPPNFVTITACPDVATVY